MPRAQESCESRGGRPRLSVPNSPYGLCGLNAKFEEEEEEEKEKEKKRKEKKEKKKRQLPRAQELCESRSGRPRHPVPNSPYGLCGRKGTFEEAEDHRGSEIRSCVKVGVAVLGSPSLPNSPFGLHGRNATLNLNHRNLCVRILNVVYRIRFHGRPGISDGHLLSRISGLSSDCPFVSSRVTVSVFIFSLFFLIFCRWSIL